SVPEPVVPDSLLALQTAVAETRVEAQQLESRWGEVRERMRELTDQMEGLARSSSQYRALFREFTDLEAEERDVGGRMRAAHDRFDQLQRQFLAEAEQLRLQREQWEDAAFADVDDVIAARLKALGRDIQTDTTEATGSVRFTVPPGKWWVEARYELPYD